MESCPTSNLPSSSTEEGCLTSNMPYRDAMEYSTSIPQPTSLGVVGAVSPIQHIGTASPEGTESGVCSCAVVLVSTTASVETSKVRGSLARGGYHVSGLQSCDRYSIRSPSSQAAQSLGVGVVLLEARLTLLWQSVVVASKTLVLFCQAHPVALASSLSATYESKPSE